MALSTTILIFFLAVCLHMVDLRTGSFATELKGGRSKVSDLSEGAFTEHQLQYVAALALVAECQLGAGREWQL